MQWQIVARSPDQEAEFYSKLFGWEVNANNALNYRMMDTGSERGINGGIWPSPPEGHALVSLYVEVENVSAYVAKAVDLGAKTLIPPQKLPDGDEMALMLDPEGIAFGIFRPVSTE
jgi:predicted enzyme related to lactoylglutathione lyase